MKARYEADYLASHREKLGLQKELEDIRSGKLHGDGAEAAFALRQRLNETVDQLDSLKKEHTELQVNFDAQARDLTIAKSDLNLVNKDQLEILATLRESVNEDKVGLEADMEKLRTQVKDMADKNRMQLEQINKLLMEKIMLQSDGIDQRDRMLQREKNYSDLKTSLNGKDLPEDIKARLLKLHEENVQMAEQLKTTQDKLNKARAFIKSQDKLFREEHARSAAASPGLHEDGETSQKTQVKILEDEIARHKLILQDMNSRYKREQEIMLSVLHSLSMDRLQGQVGKSQKQRSGPVSWLSQQRQNMSIRIRRA